jgi:putative endonuclease
MTERHQRGRVAHQLGLNAEAAACSALEQGGWTIRARRLRTAAGEIDAVAECDGLLAIIEVKARPRLADAAAALTQRQKTRLLAASDIILAENPTWGRNGVRFDVLVVDNAGRVRRIADAFRLEEPL